MYLLTASQPYRTPLQWPLHYTQCFHQIAENDEQMAGVMDFFFFFINVLLEPRGDNTDFFFNK